MNAQEMVIFFLKLQAQLQLLHWQTTKFARHLAYGDTYNTIQPLIDGFIEVYQGKNGRIYFEDEAQNITVYNISDDELETYLDSCIETLEDASSLLDDNDTDLLNIRDEILSAINKLKYLLTLE
jgi:hypothetical protein